MITNLIDLTVHSVEEFPNSLPEGDPPVTPGEKLRFVKITESTTLDVLRAQQDAEVDMRIEALAEESEPEIL